MPSLEEIEIEAPGLAAAKSRVSADTKTLQTANESKKSEEEMIAKRRKVSLSPQSKNNNTTSITAAASSPNYAYQTTSSIAALMHPAFINNNVKAESSTSNTISNTATNPNNGDEIVVTCGIPELNGLYTRVVGNSNRVVNESTIEFTKEGLWKGSTVDYLICLILERDQWEIGLSKRDGKREMRPFYKSLNGTIGLYPPENGWKATSPDYDDIEPMLTCRAPSLEPLVQPSAQPSNSVLQLKKCGKCGKPKKKHSYIINEWNKSEEVERVCRVCSRRNPVTRERR